MSEKTADDDGPVPRLKQTAALVSALASAENLSSQGLTSLIGEIYRSLGSSQASPHPAATAPAVPIKKSVTPDFLVCLEDGRKLKVLKRHLRSVHGLSVAEYRARWQLENDYPEVAPRYSAERARLARLSGLGTHGSTGAPAVAEDEADPIDTMPSEPGLDSEASTG